MITRFDASTLQRLYTEGMNDTEEAQYERYINSLFDNLAVIKSENNPGGATLFIRGEVYIPHMVLQQTGHDTGNSVMDIKAHLQAALDENETLPAIASTLEEFGIPTDTQATYRVMTVDPNEMDTYVVTIMARFRNDETLPDAEDGEYAMGMPEGI